MTHAEVLGRYLGVFVDELVAAGLENVCLCPGSRSTPLALTFARHPAIKVWTHLDERSCAYFALGMAKANATRVAILCSSGTAAVNFAPAVVEAFHSRVPLLVLTADRPPELQDLGANQTIDQVQLYGSAAKWFVQMPLPEATDEALRYVRMVASRAMATAYTEEPRGPVHLNFPFREPLVPAPYEFRVAHATPEARFTEAYDPQAPGNLDYLALKLESYERGLIVCGPNSGIYAAPELTQLAQTLGFPVLADPLSGLRCGPHYEPVILGAYDSFLHSPALVERLEPELILRFGDPPTSKPLATYMARHRKARQIAVAPPGRWPDPDLTTDEIIHCEPTQLCTQLAGLIPQVVREDGWLDSWQQAESVTRGVMRNTLAGFDAPTEPSAILDLADLLPDDYTVFAGNSMPVRDLDTFLPAADRQAYFLANRGASGIDGVVSSALGASAATGGRLVLVIGDLSFYHDMNGLLAARRHGLSATIVLLNNDGGGIFSFLPQNDDQEHFEALFGTPHGLDFAPVAQLYGLDYTRVATRDEYCAALETSFDAPGVQVIEVRTDRVANLKLHRDIWQAVIEAVDKVTSPSEPVLSRDEGPEGRGTEGAGS